jgi:hypothetical protein
MWCTSQEFLDLGVGDWEEHAILLFNYFSYIDRNNPGTDVSPNYRICITHSRTHSTHALTLLTHSLYSLTHSLTHSLSHSLTHSRYVPLFVVSVSFW